MAGSMAKLLKQAYAAKGLELPGAASKKKHGERKPTPSVHPLPTSQVADEFGTSTPAKNKSMRQVVEAWEAKHLPPAQRDKEQLNNPAPKLDMSCHQGKTQPKPAPKSSSSISLEIHNNAKILLTHYDQDELPLLDAHVSGDAVIQSCHPSDVIDERQIVLGLDFGTSSVKVVVGDPALGKAFAVPFRDGYDLARYLLPTRLYETSGTFSLNAGDTIHRDLKLSLLANPDEPVLRQRVIAFLALVIRHVRGWLLTEHREVYQRTRLFWKLAIGLPVAHLLNDELQRTFYDVAQIAWLTSITTSINLESIRTAECRQNLLRDTPENATEDEDIEVSVVPEIAAQIYGFVNSSRFNRRDPNIYLMVDVGAGSVDSSLFHVKPARGGKWDFEFFTSVVEPFGVMNLHRHRVQWWSETLTTDPRGEVLTSGLREWKFPTDRMAALPESFLHYFSGVSLNLRNEKDDPDKYFFRYKILQQVRGKSYWRAWKDGLLTQEQLRGIPAFYCGGGMRMQYYSRLQHEMQSMPGFSWLKAMPKRVELPRNLEAPGLKRQDFDRLTVAYGLSFLEVGKVTKSLPLPKLPAQPESSWQSNYVDKDYC